MAPYPKEIDVFSLPHSRMKQLVDVYNERLIYTDFADYIALESLLRDLHQTFCEFKSHEQIENKFIMKKLKKKLKSLSIHEAAVCNCHSDNSLSEMLELFEAGYSCSSKPESERINFGIKLREALMDFNKTFLPHMKEEEEVFQPMLMKYFEYEELKCLKKRVMKEHSKWAPYDEEEKVSLEEKQADMKADEVPFDNNATSLDIPPEVLSHIFSFLSPKEVIACSSVCKSWYDVSRNPALWKELYPCYWAHGIYDHYDLDHEDTITSLYPNTPFPPRHYQDEDADIDELEEHVTSDSEESTRDARTLQYLEIFTINSIIKYLLPKVGSGVQKISMALCRSLSSTMLRDILSLCPNVVYLDLSYTSIGDSAFKGLKDRLSCANLQHLDMSGCRQITDLGLSRLADCLISLMPDLPDGRRVLREVYLENCDHLSDYCYCCPDRDNFCLEIEDGGCFFQRNQFDLCDDCSASTFCNSRCMWHKNGFMCHLARSVRQCPYMNSCMHASRRDITHAANELLRTTLSEQNDNSVIFNNDTTKSYDGKDTGVLKYLNLSGCCELTDDGLMCLSEAGLFKYLDFLDVSGCWQMTGPGLCSIVNLAPCLLPENLYYCNHIEDGPYTETANGCQNLENQFRSCCCNRVG